MATTTVDHDDTEPPLALGHGGRQIGADASAEQRELLCLLLDEADSLSGMARRGILMRALALADISAELFEGAARDKDPYLLAAALYGDGSAAASKAADAVRADRRAVLQ